MSQHALAGADKVNEQVEMLEALLQQVVMIPEQTLAQY